MAIHVLVIGQHTPADSVTEAVAHRVGLDSTRFPGDTFTVRRCSATSLLVQTVLAAVRDLNQPVGILDLFDHGGKGRIGMGDPTTTHLFGPKAVGGNGVASALAPLLRHDAHVRLLGCDTARSADGKKLLIDLQAAFGKAIVVHGTLRAVDVEQFDNRGFMREQEESALFSSSEARALQKNQRPPSYDERQDELMKWRRLIG